MLIENQYYYINKKNTAPILILVYRFRFLYFSGILSTYKLLISCDLNT